MTTSTANNGLQQLAIIAFFAVVAGSFAMDYISSLTLDVASSIQMEISE